MNALLLSFLYVQPSLQCVATAAYLLVVEQKSVCLCLLFAGGLAFN